MDCDKILQTDGGSIITGLRCFSLPLILDCVRRSLERKCRRQLERSGDEPRAQIKAGRR